jgi:hypothetical protein
MAVSIFREVVRDASERGYGTELVADRHGPPTPHFADESDYRRKN